MWNEWAHLDNFRSVGLVFSSGGISPEEDLHGDECGVQLRGAGGLPLPRRCPAERHHRLGLSGLDELREDNQRDRQGHN